MNVERLEDWAGQEVVGSDGEKIGKLEDVYFTEGTDDAQVVCIKAGMLGRKLYVVPLAGASLARDHLTLGFTKNAVTDGPQIEAQQPLSSADRHRLSDHFGDQASALRDGDTYESGQVRAEQAKRARELSDEVRDLEKQAAEKRDEESQGEAKATTSGQEAAQLEERKRAAQAEADRLGG